MARKSLYTRKLGVAVARSARVLPPRKYHVISGNAKKWTVVPEGRVHPVRIFPTQNEAVQYASQTASKKAGEVIIHERTGQIKDRISFAEK